MNNPFLKFFFSIGRGTVIWRSVLLGLAVVFLLGLILAPKPWVVTLGEKHRVTEYLAIFGWYGGFLGTLTLCGLAVLAPWWAGKPVGGGSRVARTAPGWFWPGVLLAMLLSAIFSFPRLDHSLWDDEELNVRLSIVGKYSLREVDEPFKFRKADWVDTLFEWREPNNHVLHSLLARACLDATRVFWKDSTGLPFAEWPLRIPSYVFGILAVGALALFLKDLRYPAAGVIAALLLAMHPWHVRYTAECRGYSAMLFFLPLMLFFWRRALCEGAWKWWAATGICQFVLVYTLPSTAFLLIVLHVASLPLLWKSREVAGPFVAQSGRWFVTNALSAIPVFLLVIPLFAQVGKFMEAESARGVVLGWPWISSTLWHFLAGVSYFRGSSTQAVYPEIQWNFSGFPAFPWIAAGIAIILIVAGSVRMIRRGALGSVLLAAMFLPPVLIFLYSRYKTHLIYESYVISGLPGVVAMAAVGLTWILFPLQQRKPLAWLAPAGTLVVLGGYFLLTQPIRDWMAANPLQPLRESVVVSRGTLDPKDKATDHIITASFSIPPYIYDPRMIRLDDTAEMVELIRLAERENRPLVLNIGMPWAAREYSPGMWSLFNDPVLFKQKARLLGWDAGLDRIVAVYIPGSANAYDFEKALNLPR